MVNRGPGVGGQGPGKRFHSRCLAPLTRHPHLRVAHGLAVLALSIVALVPVAGTAGLIQQSLQLDLAGQPQDRNRLWIARGKLAALVRAEIAATCAGPGDYEQELAHLAPYLGTEGRRKA